MHNEAICQDRHLHVCLLKGNIQCLKSGAEPRARTPEFSSSPMPALHGFFHPSIPQFLLCAMGIMTFTSVKRPLRMCKLIIKRLIKKPFSMHYPISHTFLKPFLRIKIIETYQLCHLQLTFLDNQLNTLNT